MKNEFTAVLERDGEWYVAYSPEIPGANGQGRTVEEARASLADAIALILDDRREDGLRGVPADAIQSTVTIGRSAPLFSSICAGTAAFSNAKGARIRCGPIRRPARPKRFRGTVKLPTISRERFVVGCRFLSRKRLKSCD